MTIRLQSGRSLPALNKQYFRNFGIWDWFHCCNRLEASGTHGSTQPKPFHVGPGLWKMAVLSFLICILQPLLRPCHDSLCSLGIRLLYPCWPLLHLSRMCESLSLVWTDLAPGTWCCNCSNLALPTIGDSSCHCCNLPNRETAVALMPSCVKPVFTLMLQVWFELLSSSQWSEGSP